MQILALVLRYKTRLSESETLNSRSEKMNAKIRDFTLRKVPYVLVIGDKEEAANAVSARGKGDQGSKPLAELIADAKRRDEAREIEL